MNRLFQDFFDEGFTGPGRLATEEVWLPALDVVETPETFVVKAEVPGIDPKDIEISVSGDTLNIRGEKRAEKEEKGKTWYRVERSYGSFHRSVPLPIGVKADRVEAESKDGVLTITLPKIPEAMPKRIAVKTK